MVSEFDAGEHGSTDEQALQANPDAEKVFENSESRILVEIIQGRPVAKDLIRVGLFRPSH